MGTAGGIITVNAVSTLGGRAAVQEVEGECDANDIDGNCAADAKTAADAIVDADGDGRTRVKCEDTDHRCAAWAKLGECKNNPNYMLSKCCCDSCSASFGERVTSNSYSVGNSFFFVCSQLPTFV